MQTLIQDLLAFSRVGKQKQSLSSVDLDQTLKSVNNSLKILIEENNVQIICADNLPEVMADKSQMQQVFQYLISNAIKYHNEERTCIVQISFRKVKKFWEFSIQDNGIGMEPKYFDCIFVIFQRLHGKDKYSGTGIGLAVCKRIIEGHGGKIWVESKIETGSTFHFTLPVKSKV